MRSSLLIIVGAIFALGLVMIFSTSSAEVLDLDLQRSTHQALIKQIGYAVVGAMLAGGVYVIGYKNLLRLSPVLLVIFTFLLVLVLIPGIGREVNGSKRWIHLAGLSLQPSEFVKYLVPLTLIQFFLIRKFKTSKVVASISETGVTTSRAGSNTSKGDSNNSKSILNTPQTIIGTSKTILNTLNTVTMPQEAAIGSSISFKELVFFLLPLGIPMGLILVEPNNGTVAVIGVGVTMVLLMTRVPLKYWAVPLVVCAMLGGVIAVNHSYVSARLKVYMNPELDLQGKGHQPHQAKIAAGSGGFLGKGPGNSWQKLSYLPEAQNDYIGAIYAEEFGFLGMIVLITLYMIFALLGFRIANYSSDIQGFYIATFVTFLVCFQAFLNLGVVSGILPSTGLNLPLFSQGGSSLIANFMGVGLLCSVARSSEV